ncbi:MAG: type II secretion system F family protein [Verrucomicrobiales bacterium]
MASLSARAKSRVYASLEKYARSGMGIEKACESLLAQPRVSATERRVYHGLLAGLKQGESIGDALGRSDGVVSELEREVVSAAEEGGTLEKGFGHLSEYFRRVDRTRRRILKGLTYPIVLVHLAVPVSAMAVAVFRGFSLDGSTPAGQTFSNAFANAAQTMLVVYLLIAILVVGAVILSRLSRRSGAVDALVNRIPLLGKARRAVAMERFSQVFEIFLLAGKKMSDSLAGAGKASGSGLIREASQAGSRLVAQGDRLAAAIYAAPSAFPHDFARGIDAAEESGQLDRELAEWGRFYSEAAAEAMEQLAEWTPKLFYWGILALVAFLIIRAALAYRDLLENLLNATP